MELRFLICWMVITQKDSGIIHSRTIASKSKKACEEKLAKLLVEMKTEASAVKERLKEIAVAS